MANHSPFQEISFLMNIYRLFGSVDHLYRTIQRIIFMSSMQKAHEYHATNRMFAWRKIDG